MENKREVVCPHCFSPVWMDEDVTVTACPICGGIVFDSSGREKEESAEEDKGLAVIFLAGILLVLLPVLLGSCLSGV